MVNKVYKFGTGDTIPVDAIFLSTLYQKVKSNGARLLENDWLVWHYFLVEVEDGK